MEPRRSAIETYRYLRVALVGLAVLLAVAVANQGIADGALLDSISAYYYTPVRDVLVGVLMALGLGLVAVRGRGVEDVLLNLAGMLAPVVAFVPTPVSSGWFAYSPLDGTQEGVPSSYGEAFRDDTAVWSLLLVGVVGVVFAGCTVTRLDGRDRAVARRGVAASAAIVLGFGAWLAIGPDSFHRGAHYVAAVGMFAVFVVVARLNARSAADAAEGPVMTMLPARRRRAAYPAISWAMLVTVATGGVLGLLQLADVVPVGVWLLVVEAVLLALFAAFWTLQTVEYWRDGVPVD